MKMGLNKLGLIIALVGGYFAHQNLPEKNKNAPAAISPAKHIVQTIDHLKYQVTKEEVSEEQLAAEWERENQSQCRDVANVYDIWKNAPREESLVQAFKLIGFHSSKVRRKMDDTFKKKSPVILAALENYSVPCGHRPEMILKISKDFKEQSKGKAEAAFFELVKLNYNHLSKVNSFKGIALGLEMLKEGTEERLYSSRDRHELKSLIRKSKVLNVEYHQELLDNQGQEEQIQSVTSYYEEEIVLLRTKVRLYLEKISENHKSVRTAKL